MIYNVISLKGYNSVKTIMEVISIISTVLSIIMTVMMSYKIIIGIVGLFGRKKYKEATKNHTYAFLIAGRNEKDVIGQLIDSILSQNYEREKVKIFVVADNCTDNTAEIVRSRNEYGNVYCFERFNKEKVGKGYALDFLLERIKETLPDYKPDAFMVFDADNLLDKNYIYEMNKVFDSGEKIITSYRNSKNFNTNWITATTAMNFLRECRFIHNGRNILGTSTYVSGTGFCVSSELLNTEVGWKYTTLTEDIEFSTCNIMKGNKVAYCNDAIFYDEQPTTFKASWDQRMRWQKGFYQCFWAYFSTLFLSIFTKQSFASYEMSLMLFPFTIVTFFWGILQFVFYVILSFVKTAVPYMIEPLANFISLTIVMAGTSCIILFIYGLLILISERKRVKTTFWQKIKYSFMFSIYILSYIPIAIVCTFKKNVKWKRIPHEDKRTIEDIEKVKS